MGVLDDAIREHLDLKRRRGGDPTEIERAEREALGPVRREPTMPAAYMDESPATAEEAPFEVAGDHPQALELDFETEASAGSEAAFETRAGAGDFSGDAPTSINVSPDETAPSDPRADETVGDPGFDEFAATEPAGSAGLEFEPAAPVSLEPEPVFEPVHEPEPKAKRRSLFGRHRHDEDSGHADLAAGDTFEDDEPSPGAAPPPPLRLGPEPEAGNTVEYDVEQAFLDEDGAEPAVGEDILEVTPDFLADTPDHDRLWFEQKPPPDFDFDK